MLSKLNFLEGGRILKLLNNPAITAEVGNNRTVAPEGNGTKISQVADPEKCHLHLAVCTKTWHGPYWCWLLSRNNQTASTREGLQKQKALSKATPPSMWSGLLFPSLELHDVQICWRGHPSWLRALISVMRWLDKGLVSEEHHSFGPNLNQTENIWGQKFHHLAQAPQKPFRKHSNQESFWGDPQEWWRLFYLDPLVFYFKGLSGLFWSWTSDLNCPLQLNKLSAQRVRPLLLSLHFEALPP